MKTMLTALCVTAAMLGTGGEARAAESYDACQGTIASVPATISSQGIWCMKSDLATSVSSGFAIKITVSNVTIDCNGFKLGGLGAGAGTATVGILAPNVLNTRVRNCNVRGFANGVQADGTGVIVEDSRFEANTQRGVLLYGGSNVVRRTIVLDTGGSTLGSGAAFGIDVYGDTHVQDSFVDGVNARTGSNQSANGIRISNDALPANGDISGNRVGNIVRDGTGAAIGVRLLSTGRVAVRGNALFGTGVGYAIQCANTNGAVRDNMMLGWGGALSGCPNDGGNIAK